MNKNEYPIWHKYMLTINEAVMYFNIGENKLRRLINEDLASEQKFVIQNGKWYMIKRKKFEELLDQVDTI